MNIKIILNIEKYYLKKVIYKWLFFFATIRLTKWRSPHGDYDHIGKAINLVNNFKVEKVIFNCGEVNELEQELIKVLENKKVLYCTSVKELNIDNYKRMS